MCCCLRRSFHCPIYLVDQLLSVTTGTIILAFKRDGGSPRRASFPIPITLSIQQPPGTLERRTKTKQGPRRRPSRSLSYLYPRFSWEQRTTATHSFPTPAASSTIANKFTDRSTLPPGRGSGTLALNSAPRWALGSKQFRDTFRGRVIAERFYVAFAPTTMKIPRNFDTLRCTKIFRRRDDKNQTAPY